MKMYSISVGLFLLAVSHISAEETSTYSTFEPEDLLSTFDQFYETVDNIKFHSDLTHFIPTLNATSITSVHRGRKKWSPTTTTSTLSPADQHTPTTLSSTEEDEKRWETAILPEDTAPHLYDPPSPWTVPPRIKSFTGNYTRNPKYPQKQIYGNYTPPFKDEHYKNYQNMFYSPSSVKPNQGYGQPQYFLSDAPQLATHHGPPQQVPFKGPPTVGGPYNAPEWHPTSGPYNAPEWHPTSGPYNAPEWHPTRISYSVPPWHHTSSYQTGPPPSQVSPGGKQPEPLLGKQIELDQIPNHEQLDQGYYRGPPRRFYRGRFNDQQHSPGQNNRSQFGNNYSRQYRRRFDGYRRWPSRTREHPPWVNYPPYPHPGGYWPENYPGQGHFPVATPPQLMPTPLQAMPPPRPLQPPPGPSQVHSLPHRLQQHQLPPTPPPVSPPPPPPPYQRGGFIQPPYVPQNAPGQNPYVPNPGSYPDPRYPNYQQYAPPSPPPHQHAPQYPSQGPPQSNHNWPPSQNHPNPHGYPKQRALNEGNEYFQYPPEDPRVNRQRHPNNKPQFAPPPNPNQQPNV